MSDEDSRRMEFLGRALKEGARLLTPRDTGACWELGRFDSGLWTILAHGKTLGDCIDGAIRNMLIQKP